MSEKRKMIAVCLSHSYEDSHSAFVSALCSNAAKRGWKLLFFNSFPDFSNQDKYDEGARSVFECINYEILDGMIIAASTFHDDALLRSIVQSCHTRHIPVVSKDTLLPGCAAVVPDSKESYKQLLNHVIRDHDIRDTFFIAGLENEEYSDSRIACYKEVLEENGLPVLPENIAYGNYWEGPTVSVTEKLISERDKLPGAIFCANDTMAHAVITCLKEHDIRVPEDVIVTGFDGIRASRVYQPHLTTCMCDAADEASACLDLLDGDFQAGRVFNVPYYVRYAASCGCKEIPIAESEIVEAYRDMEFASRHETYLFRTAHYAMDCQDINSLLGRLSDMLQDDSVLCLNEHFYYGDGEEKDFTRALDHTLICVPSANRILSQADWTRIFISDIFPRFDHWMNDEGATACMITSVFVGDIVCGYYVTPMNRVSRDIQTTKRTANILNFIFANLISQITRKNMLLNLENNLYLDPMTGISNLKGATRWYEEHANDSKARQKAFAVSVYSVVRYNYIFDNYGMEDIEWVMHTVTDALRKANEKDALVARIADDQLIVINTADNGSGAGAKVSKAVNAFFALIEEANAGSPKVYNIEVNCGCTVADDGWKNSLETYIKLAVGNLYLNRLKYGHGEALKESAQSKEIYQAFTTLMDHNLFRYHFQPIVDAKTGSIYAYEALMRTEPGINLTPLEVLNTAREYGRLDEVEKITFFGIMNRYKQDYNLFRGSKVFINTIPGHFLGTADVNRIFELYEDYLDCFVFELTEQDSITDDELNSVKQLCKAGSQAHIAIDDYGTGHSNIANLLRYSPQVIKIDRFLIHDIRHDTNKQMFLKSTIEFAHTNGIKTLAEGVESFDELQTVIEYGIDLIQGFYTARPTELPIPAISEKVRNEIISENVRLSKFDSDMLVYTAHEGETISLLELALQKYTFVDIPAGTVTLKGEKDHTVEIVIRQPDNTDATVILENVNIKGSTETTFQIGQHCNTVITLKGANTFNKEGIRVPPTSTLSLQGYGSLTVVNNRNYGVGIGASFNDPYGSISIDMVGKLTIKASGDKVIGIGGGNSEGNGIRLNKGNCRISAKGINLVAVGSSNGPADISIGENFILQTDVEGNDALSVGSLEGEAHIISAGNLTLVTDGERSTGIGTMTGKAKVVFEKGSVFSIVHCDLGTCIGTLNGEADVRVIAADVNVRGEGNKVSGFGSIYGITVSEVCGGRIRGEVLASEAMLLGNERSRFVVTGGNILLNPDDLRGTYPVSPGGRKLERVELSDDHFEQEISDGNVTYLYAADIDPDTGEFAVWI